MIYERFQHPQPTPCNTCTFYWQLPIYFGHVTRREKRNYLVARIEQTLEERGMLKKDLAALMGLDSSAVTRFFDPHHNLTIDKLLDLEEALKITIIWY